MNFVFVSQKQPLRSARPLSPTFVPPPAVVERAEPVAMPVKPVVPVPGGRNRRWSDRAPISRPALASPPGLTPVSCFVCNLSKFGAMLDIDGDHVPDAFTLVFTHNRIRSEANCIVRWRSGNRIGVHFAGPVRTTVDARKAM